MTDCEICGKPIGEHEPWLVWHTGGVRPGIKRAPPFRTEVAEVRNFGTHGADYGDRQAL